MQYSEIKPSLLKINNWKELLMKKNGKQKEQTRYYLNKYCLDLYLRKGFRVDSLWLCDNKTIIFNPQTCHFQYYRNKKKNISFLFKFCNMLLCNIVQSL